MKTCDTDILHSGGLENLQDYKVFRRRYPYRVSLPIKSLSDWYIQEISSSETTEVLKICLVGICNGAVIKTSPVTSVISTRKVCTLNCIYLLNMPSKVLENPLRGIEKYFVYGFPSDWEKILEEAAKNTEQEKNQNMQMNNFKVVEQTEEQLLLENTADKISLDLENKENPNQALIKNTINYLESNNQIYESHSISEKTDLLDEESINLSLAELKHKNTEDLIENQANFTPLNIKNAHEVFNNPDSTIFIQEKKDSIKDILNNHEEIKNVDDCSLNEGNTIKNAEKDQSIIDRINLLFQSTTNNCDTNSDSQNYDESLLDDNINFNSRLSNKKIIETGFKSAENSKINISRSDIKKRRNSEPKNSANSNILKKALTVEEFICQNSPFMPLKKIKSIFKNGQTPSNFESLKGFKNNGFISPIENSGPIVVSELNNVTTIEKQVFKESENAKSNFLFSKIDQKVFSSNSNEKNTIDVQNTNFQSNMDEKSFESNYAPQANLKNSENLNLENQESNNMTILSQNDNEFQTKAMKYENLDLENQKSNNMTILPQNNNEKDKSQVDINLESYIENIVHLSETKKPEVLDSDFKEEEILDEQSNTGNLNNSLSIDNINELSIQLNSENNNDSNYILNHNDSLMVLCDDDTINPAVSKSKISDHDQFDTQNLHDGDIEKDFNLSILSNHSNSSISSIKKKTVKKLKVYKKSSLAMKYQTPCTTDLLVRDIHKDTKTEEVFKNLESSSSPKIIEECETKASIAEDNDEELNKNQVVKKISIRLSRTCSSDTIEPSPKKSIENAGIDLDDTIVSICDDSASIKENIPKPTNKPINAINIQDNSILPVKVVNSLETCEQEITKSSNITKNKKRKTILKLPTYFNGRSKKLNKK